ncbi:MAG: TA system VapC family ribonuclease toxin [Pyrinomonadaceae bacterium]
MIISDANILIYAYNTDAVYHDKCKKWLGEQFSKPEPFAFCWQTITAFLRITTTAKIFPEHFTQEEVRGFIGDWMTHQNTRILTPGARHWTIFERLLAETKIVGAKTMDAHLSALAIEHGVVLATADRDFSIFKGLKTFNPIDL